ncbi:MAG: Bax inhibitor-1/YccA family protein [Anaerolineae bacterium]|nr:Bax inhibitor-1/YccA family protein [Anaerolineae bacterium]
MSEWFGSRADSLPLGGLRVEIRPLMRNVYLWMFFGLLVTTVISLITVNTPAILELAFNRVIFFGAIIAEFALVIALGAALRRMSPGMAMAMFIGYAALNGFTLSLIFLVYDLGAISNAFLTTAFLFAAMSAIGYFTEIDLSRYSSYLIMGLIGLIIASVVNLFLRSSGFDFLISLFGVVLFTALTAYDTQKLKMLAADPTIGADGSIMLKLSIYGALTLYLDFINLFLFLLRLFGRRN